jgi:tetratricopeptide (TPR) repeat protein
MAADVPTENQPLNDHDRPVSFLARVVMVLGLGLFAYHNAFDGPFLFDDWGNIVESPATLSLWPDQRVIANNRPLVLYSFAVNRALFGLNVQSYHAVNVGLHLINASLLFFVVVEFLGSSAWRDRVPDRQAIQLGFLVATLWVVHPLTTQSVTYMAQRYETAMATCFLVCIWAALRSWQTGRPAGWLALSVGACWLGFWCKEVMAVGPCLIPLIDRVATGRRWRDLLSQRSWYYVALWTPWLWFIRVFVASSTSSRSMGFGYKKITPWEYLGTQPEVICHYLRLTFWPDVLCLDYLWPVERQLWISLALGIPLATLFLAGLVLAYRGSLSGLLLTAFFFILAPTSSIVPIADLANEHRMYLPLACVVMGVVALASQWINSLVKRGRLSDAGRLGVTAALFLVAVSGLSWRTIERNSDYLSGIRIWSSALRTNPRNPRAWYNLGTEYQEAGHFDHAMRMYREGLKIGAPMAELHYGLGECLRSLGEQTEAETAYRQALAINPDHPQARNALGVSLQRRGLNEAALAAFEHAAGFGMGEAIYNRASLKIELGRHAEAIRELREILRTQPDFKLARRRLAWALSTASNESLRDGQAALSELKQCGPLTPESSPWMADTYAATYALLGDYPRAVAAATQAVNSSRAAAETEQLAMRRRLETYRRGEPYFQSPSQAATSVEREATP